MSESKGKILVLRNQRVVLGCGVADGVEQKKTAICSLGTPLTKRFGFGCTANMIFFEFLFKIA